MDYRVSTRDVDAIFESNREFVRRAAVLIATEFSWSPDWINDGVKGFLSGRDTDQDAKRLFRTFPSESTPGLRVFVASPEYLFAMKCMAMRIGGLGSNDDIDDIRQLGLILAVKSVRDALAIVGKFYPRERLPPKTYFGLEEIFGAD